MAGPALPQHAPDSLMGKIITALKELRSALEAAIKQDDDALAKSTAQNMLGPVYDMLALTDKTGEADTTDPTGKNTPSPEAKDDPVNDDPKPGVPPKDEPVKNEPAKDVPPADKPATP